jgi:hypothetical protein
MQHTWFNPKNNRFYVARISTDLLGDVLIDRYWGSTISARGGNKPLLVKDLAAADQAMMAIKNKRKSNGYLLVS